MLPKTYRSSTLILVENPKIQESYVNPVIRGSLADRLSMIQQQVMSRTMLSNIIQEFNLLEGQQNQEGQDGKQQGHEALIESLRKVIKIETKGSGHIEAFSISFAHSDPTIAMKVTERLASSFIESNLKAREQLVEGTTEFLDIELKRAKESLEEQERAMAQFKRRYMGELPSQIDANLQTLNRLQKDLGTVTDQIQSRSDRRAGIQKMIQAYETLGLTFLENPQSPSRTSDPPSQSVIVRGTGRRGEAIGGDPLRARLRELERTLMTLKTEYKDTYPDVVQVKKEIASMNAKLAGKDEVGAKESEKDLEEQPKDVPLQTGKLQTQKGSSTAIDPYLHDLRREREEVEIGTQMLADQQRKLTAQIREYEQRVEKAPEREQEMLVLQRDYDNTKRNYQALLEKQLNARISENLEKHQKGESFRLLDSANLPIKPESPDPMRIMLIGLLAGCGFGYGAAFGLELMAGVIRRPEEVESLFGLPVLAAIPHFEFAYENESTKALPGSSATSPSGVSPNGSMPALRPALPEKFQSGQVRKGVGLLWKKASFKSRYGPKNGTASDSIMLELNLVAKWRPLSMVAEQFRVAATRLVLSSANQKSTVIVVTSALKGEGKSTTASNLAYVLAQDLGKQTLLIDCDFKRPMIHVYTGVPSKPGLVEAIYGDAPLETCLHRSGDVPLWVLPSGRRDHRLVDLTKIPQINGILTELRTRFEFIILDAPPILPLADMNLLASMADMLVMVVRAGVTHHELVQKSLNTIKPLSRAGVILTGYDQGNDSEYLQDYHHAGRGTYRR